MKFLDTNALLELQERAFEDYFICSMKTLEELENIKTSSHKDIDVKLRARKISKMLRENSGSFRVVDLSGNQYSRLEEILHRNPSPDDVITYAASTMINEFPDIVFETNDVCCQNIAEQRYGLNVVGINDGLSDYLGYKEVSLSDDELAYFYEHMNENQFDLLVNEYLLITNAFGDPIDKYKWNGDMHETVLSKPYKSKMFGTIKPKDDIQAFAMDSISNNDITVLYGKSGSGKTTLPLNYIMQQIEKEKIKKCYIVFSYEPLRGAKTLGYEKGTHEEKILMYGSIGNLLASKFGDIEEVRYLVERGILEIIPTANIRGIEIPADCCCYVTEAQNLDIYTLKTIIQRCKTGCKQIYEGDILEQKDTNITTTGIHRMIEVFKGHKNFGVLKLKNNYRSELAELADLM